MSNTFSLPAHSRPTVLTLLLQDEVPGLQLLINGHWIAANPIPNYFVINIGDQLQVLSNGRYKSVLHRAVVSSSKARISIPTFLHPFSWCGFRPCTGIDRWRAPHNTNVIKIFGIGNRKRKLACSHPRISKYCSTVLRKRTWPLKACRHRIMFVGSQFQIPCHENFTPSVLACSLTGKAKVEGCVVFNGVLLGFVFG